MAAPKDPKTAEYSYDGKTVTGDVVKTGKTYADVKWPGKTKTERVRYSDKGVTFKS